MREMINVPTKIAIFFDEYNRPNSVFNPSTVKVMAKLDDNWVTEREIQVFLDMKNGIANFRKDLSDFVNNLKDTDVVVAAEVSGIPYKVLDQEGFDICECEEFSIDLLDKILDAKNKEEICCEPPNVEVDTAPVEGEIAGNYFLDLKKLLIKKSSLTSKQALLPFLKENPFQVLDVLCSHVPPWFDLEFDKLGFNKEITKISENEYVVKIYKKLCCE